MALLLLHTSTIPLSIHLCISTSPISRQNFNFQFHHSYPTPSLPYPYPRSQFRATSTYVYPDPIPEFAQSETRKFRAELLKKLSLEKEAFGDDLVRVVDLCAEIFGDFLHKEYGGPGTLLVEPFTDMLVALKEKKLPGAPLAARESLLWAQNYVDQDWQVWNSIPT